MNNNLGFTLLEVLVALAILSIALTAILKSTSQNIHDTTYLQQKTIATWVGTSVISQIQAGLLSKLSESEELSDETIMLGQTWLWKVNVSRAGESPIQKIEVTVRPKNDERPVVELVGYRYEP